MKNHPFIVWSSCFLWFTAIFFITWSLILFCCMGDMLVLTGLDLVNSFVLLSGIIMIPMNAQLLYYIANGKRISRDSNVVCCPLWLCVIWIILIDVAAALLCVKRISWCRQNTYNFIEESMKFYRTCPKYKRFMDNIQWSLKCCGLESYRDWFAYDWYDKIRDYEWDPSSNSHRQTKQISSLATDSVPLRQVRLKLCNGVCEEHHLLSILTYPNISNVYLLPLLISRKNGKKSRLFCCKSGSCISNYLMELGTHSINTRGCGTNLHKLVMITLISHLVLFILVIIDEILVLRCIMKQDRPCTNPNVRRKFDVRQIMTAKDNFEASSRSTQINPDESDEDSYKEPHKKDETD